MIKLVFDPSKSIHLLKRPPPKPGRDQKKDYKGNKQDIDLERDLFKLKTQKFLCWYFLVLTSVWILFVGVCVFWNANPCSAFVISDSVLVALVSGISVNVIGLLVIAAKFVFYAQQEDRHN